ncbi:hypothetical protein [Myroides odoratimimus]|uniref:hypothetical protein n=1 Tax=Myroides odoratimimus TaxID=76832 RepID=UPI00091E16A4|nr:hypothetical protein [Myroides odoratimimus]SHL45234.1 hypothetical protein SAMN05444275_104148 [Myroides odoratimimus subsp. xuanwuensis]
MTTLSTNQIKQIEDTLISKYNIKYQDTRDEVLDHIACEIEELMNEGDEYEEAMELVFNKWHSKLLLEHFGVYKGIPKFISRPIVKLVTQPNWTVYLLTFFVSIGLTVFFSIQKISAITAFVSILTITITVATISLYNTKRLKGYYLDIYKRLLVMEISVSVLLFVLMTFLDNLLQLNYSSIDSVVMYHFTITWYHIYLFRNLIKKGQVSTS